MKLRFFINKSIANPGKWYVMTITGRFVFYYEDSFKDAIIRMDLLASKAEMSA